MHFSRIATVTLALVGPALASPIIAARSALQFTNVDYERIAVGSSVPIMWSGNAGAVTVNLKSGEASNLQTASTIAGKSSLASVFILSFKIFKGCCANDWQRESGELAPLGSRPTRALTPSRSSTLLETSTTRHSSPLVLK